MPLSLVSPSWAVTLTIACNGAAYCRFRIAATLDLGTLLQRIAIVMLLTIRALVR